MATTHEYNPDVYKPEVAFSHHWTPPEIILVTQDPVPCVIAPVGCRTSSSITPLRMYRVRAMGAGIKGGSPDNSFEMLSNEDRALYCLWNHCAHLGNTTKDPDTQARWRLVWVPMDELPAGLR